jgi:hypothetical protein
VRGFSQAAEAFAKDCGENRVIASRLFSDLVRNPELTGWNGPYLDGMPYPTDPWETPWIIRRTGTKLRIASAGPDRKNDTADDIVVETILK